MTDKKARKKYWPTSIFRLINIIVMFSSLLIVKLIEETRHCIIGKKDRWVSYSMATRSHWWWVVCFPMLFKIKRHMSNWLESVKERFSCCVDWNRKSDDLHSESVSVVNWLETSRFIDKTCWKYKSLLS